MNTARRGHVYALCDCDGNPYYIGRTSQSPGVRLGEHRREATRRGRTSPCHLRTLQLIEEGRGPAVWVLQSGIPLPKLLRRERHWISYGEGAGWLLLNYHGGGDGRPALGEDDRRRQAIRAAAQPRDRAWRFLPFGAEDERPAAALASLDAIPF